jgi:anti-sigma factor RsiW
LVYQRRKHFINLFVWPAASDSAKTTKAIEHQGYQLLHWADSDFNYWAVSDVNEKDLQTFKQQFDVQVAPH